ncbi:hypothetical protein M569_08843, partial [Genlisea aurea]
VKETFFPDDPLGKFRDVSGWKKASVWVQSMFPIVEWGRKYKIGMLRGDLIAGLTIASLAVPQDLGYAKLANLDPQFGLYSSFVPPLIYAALGSSRDIAIGPVAVVSLLLGTMLRNEIDPKNKLDYERLAFTATFFAGITQFVLGFFRLGFIIDFLSHATIVGFMAGAAITIGLQQLKGFFGIKNFTTKTNIVSVLRSVFHNVKHSWNWETIVLGAAFLIFILLCKFIGKKYKKLFWVAAIAPLLSVIIATFFVYITHAEKRGVQVVGHIKRGVNPSSVHQIHFTGHYVLTGFRIGVVAGLIGLTEAVAIGRTFAAAKDYHLDGNSEMLALGAMNVIGSMTSCYVATGSFSRSAVNYAAGCNTALSNIVMSVVLLLTLEVITPLFKYTPNAILSSIIIAAVVGLIDIPAMILIWKIDKFDFIACMGAFFGVVFISVEIGLLIAVGISFVKILLQVSRPRTVVLGKIPRTNVYRNLEQYPEATKLGGILIVRVDYAIYFSNSNYVRESILRRLALEDKDVKQSNRQSIQYLIIEMSPVTDVDTSGIHALDDLYRTLQKRNVQLVLANPGSTVLDKLYKSGFADTIGAENMFLTVADAVAGVGSKQE